MESSIGAVTAGEFLELPPSRLTINRFGGDTKVSINGESGGSGIPDNGIPQELVLLLLCGGVDLRSTVGHTWHNLATKKRETPARYAMCPHLPHKGEKDRGQEEVTRRRVFPWGLRPTLVF